MPKVRRSFPTENFEDKAIVANSNSGDVSAQITRQVDFDRDSRHKKIELAAYFKAERRGFAPGNELDDWLEAEREVDEAAIPLPSY